MSGLDRAVGRIVSTARASPGWNNTLVVFLSDGGAGEAGANTPYRGVRGELGEGAVRVPALLAGGAVAQWADTALQGVTHITDILPTILHLAGPLSATVFNCTLDCATGHSGPLKTDGENLWPALTAGRPAPRRTLVLRCKGGRGGC